MTKFLTFALILMSFCAISDQDNYFLDLLDDSGLAYEKPQTMIELKPRDNSIISYENALRDKNNKFEIRYVIRPISMLEIDYKDAHSSAPTPNHIFPLLFQTLINNLSDLSNSSTKEYSPIDAKKFFNANWAAVALINLNNEFSDEFKQLLMIAIHKDDAADAYTMILFNNYDEVKHNIEKIIKSLRFK